MQSDNDSLLARQAALKWVGSVLNGQAVPGEDSHHFKALDPAKRAEAGRLANAILKHRANMDAILQPFFEKGPPQTIRRIFYLGLVEAQLFGTEAHALVHSGVELAKRDPGTKGKFSGFANAILRKIADLPEGKLAAMKPVKLPKPLRGPMIAGFSQPIVEKIEAAHASTPPVDLAFKPGTDMAAYADLGVGHVDTHLRLTPGTRFSDLPGFETGAFWVQDFAAQLPVIALGDVKDLRVLDLCAAPGGKTLQLAARGAQVTALDISEKRLKRLDENLGRTGLTAEIICADALDWQPDAPFDVVVLDAPCSATGTIRRHPDLPYLKSTADIAALADLQRKLVVQAADWLSDQGRLMMITCSLIPKEGELLADWVTANVAGLQPAPMGQLPDGILNDDKTRGRTRPDMMADQGGMDGFFFAQFSRESR